MQRPSTLLAIGFAFLIGLPVAQAAPVLYTTTLAGSNENPPTGSPGIGVGTVTIDTAVHTLHVTSTFVGLTSNTTASHIHCCAAPGINAGVATTVPSFVGFPLGVTSGAMDQTYDMTLAGTWNPAFITANGGTPATAEAALAAGLAAGLSYLNVHTTGFPGGELRGNLTPQADLSITKTDGATTVTAGGTVTYTIVASNAGPNNAPGSTVADSLPATLTGATWTCAGAFGGTCTAAGSGTINDTVNLPAGGSVTYTLSATVSLFAAGTLSNAATVVTAAGITDPTPGNNVVFDTDTVTPANPAPVLYTTTLAGANENPPNGSPGTGAATVTIDTAVHTLHVISTFGGLTSNTTASHIHCCAAPGINAGVVTTVPSFVGFPLGVTSGTMDQTYDMTLAGTWNPAFITANGGTPATAEAALAAGLAAGLAYLNVHTTGFPGGELRGNLALAPQADLSITKTDGATTVTAGGTVTYTIVASNAGPSNAPGSTVTDSLPATLTGATWTCAGAVGGTCTISGSGNIGDTVNLPAGGSVTYTVTATLSPTATGTLSNTATVATGAGVSDLTPGNNSVTDTDTINALTYVVTGVASPVAGGTITCASPVTPGNTTTCIVTADPGRQIVSISGCGGTPGNTSPFTTGPITAACTVSAVFSAAIIPTLQSAALAVLALLLAGAGWLRLRRRRF